MEKARLALDYIDVLRWPVLIAFIVFGFRSRLGRLMEQLTEIEGLGMRGKFEKAVEQAEDITESGNVTEAAVVEAPLNAIIPIKVTGFNDLRKVGETFREGIPVLLDISEADKEMRKRSIDFAAGVVFTGRGRINRLGAHTFYMLPVMAIPLAPAGASTDHGSARK